MHLRPLRDHNPIGLGLHLGSINTFRFLIDGHEATLAMFDKLLDGRIGYEIVDIHFGGLRIAFADLGSRLVQHDGFARLRVNIRQLKVFEVGILLGRYAILRRMHVLVWAVDDLHHLLKESFIRDLDVHISPLLVSFGLVFLRSKRWLLVLCHIDDFPSFSCRTPIGLIMNSRLERNAARTSLKANHNEILIASLVDLTIIIILRQIPGVVVNGLCFWLSVWIEVLRVHHVLHGVVLGVALIGSDVLGVRILSGLIIVRVISLVAAVISSRIPS